MKIRWLHRKRNLLNNKKKGAAPEMQIDGKKLVVKRVKNVCARLKRRHTRMKMHLNENNCVRAKEDEGKETNT